MTIPLIGSAGAGRASARSALVGRQTDIQAPPEFAEAVELYARNNGRHATMKFVPMLNCWVIEFSLRATDKLLRLFKEGRVGEGPKEPVYLWEYVTATPQPNESQRIARLRQTTKRKGGRLDCYVGYNLADLGVTGLVQWLEEGNTWGRGVVRSHEKAVKDQMDKREEADARREADAKDRAVKKGMERRRQALGIPFLGVGIDLKKGPESAPGAKR